MPLRAPCLGVREPGCSYTTPVPPCWAAAPEASVPGCRGLLHQLQGQCSRSRESLQATGRGAGYWGSSLSSLKGRDKGVDRLGQHLLSHLDSKPAGERASFTKTQPGHLSRGQKGAPELPAAHWPCLNGPRHLLILLQTSGGGGVAGSLGLCLSLQGQNLRKNSTRVCALSASFASGLAGRQQADVHLKDRAGAAGTANSR